MNWALLFHRFAHVCRVVQIVDQGIGGTELAQARLQNGTKPRTVRNDDLARAFLGLLQDRGIVLARGARAADASSNVTMDRARSIPAAIESLVTAPCDLR